MNIELISRIREEFAVPVYCHEEELAVLTDTIQNLTARFERRFFHPSARHGLRTDRRSVHADRR